MNQGAPLADLFGRLRAEVREARYAAALEEARAWAARQPVAAATASDLPASWPMRIALGDLLRWRDADFVHACYQAVLRRPPDPDGYAFYLNEVRTGRSRIEVALMFVNSEEGRKAGVLVAGAAAAAWKLRLGRIPVLGYFLRLARALLMLPRQVREREAVEAYLLARIAIAEADCQRIRLEMAYLHERLTRNLGARLTHSAEDARAFADLERDVAALRAELAAFRNRPR